MQTMWKHQVVQPQYCQVFHKSHHPGCQHPAHLALPVLLLDALGEKPMRFFGLLP